MINMNLDFGKYYEAPEPGRSERAHAWATAMREWVLDWDTVEYELSCMIEKSLAYDFDNEKKFKYKGLSEDAFVEHFASFISGIWQIHPFREGNTRTIALFAIKYLKSMRHDVTNDLFAEKSWYFRNALVRANYSNIRLNVDKTQLPLEEFFKVLIYGDEIELHNRFLRIGQECGTPAADAVTGLHRQNGTANVGINVGINLTQSEEESIKALLRNPKLTAPQLGELLDMTSRQAERIIASLKKKAGLKRRGARKNGEWCFDENAELRNDGALAVAPSSEARRRGRRRYAAAATMRSDDALVVAKRGKRKGA